jgi:hypothetical protein
MKRRIVGIKMEDDVASAVVIRTCERFARSLRSFISSAWGGRFVIPLFFRRPESKPFLRYAVCAQ